MMLKYIVACILRPRGKHSFISSLPNNSKVLDVGCGNASVLAFKELKPTIYYVGVDVADFRQTERSKLAMDEYYIFDPIDFACKIDSLACDFDAVVWSHNIEHCNDRVKTIYAVLRRLKVGGKLYLSFPSEASVNYPNRIGTLNYFDDETHRDNPPNFFDTLQLLECNGFKILFCINQYKPFFLRCVGWLMEPISIFLNEVKLGTWEHWGFESIVQARKESHKCKVN